MIELLGQWAAGLLLLFVFSRVGLVATRFWSSAGPRLLAAHALSLATAAWFLSRGLGRGDAPGLVPALVFLGPPQLLLLAYDALPYLPALRPGGKPQRAGPEGRRGPKAKARRRRERKAPVSPPRPDAPPP